LSFASKRLTLRRSARRAQPGLGAGAKPSRAGPTLTE
jgi:hypothetical protein